MCGRMDLTRYRRSLHAHDFTPGGTSRVVMIRKKEQRTFASTNASQEAVFETLTKETVQTFRGKKIERKITSQKCDLGQDKKEITDKLSRISMVSNNGEDRGTKKWPEAKRVVGSTKKKRVEWSDSFAQECLETHNQLRARHNSPPLSLSKKLCRYSEEWARELASKGEMEHREESSYGENLFQVWSPSGLVLHGSEPVLHWYNEMSDHPFGREPSTLKSGHFSQVVWVESAELGVGVAKSKTGQIFVVCNYNPPGNFVGSFAPNVPPLGGFNEPPKSLASEVKNDSEFQSEMLRLHNEYRARHSSPPLKLDPQLSDYAQEWALRLAKECKLEHRPRNPNGENIFCMWSTEVASPRDACSTWYAESKNFQYGVEPKLLQSGHFSQMVWYGSREIGVGRAKSKTGQVMIVANYRPRGNIIGQFSSNVLKPIKGVQRLLTQSSTHSSN